MHFSDHFRRTLAHAFESYGDTGGLSTGCHPAAIQNVIAVDAVQRLDAQAIGSNLFRLSMLATCRETPVRDTMFRRDHNGFRRRFGWLVSCRNSLQCPEHLTGSSRMANPGASRMNWLAISREGNWETPTSKALKTLLMQFRIVKDRSKEPFCKLPSS